MSTPAAAAFAIRANLDAEARWAGQGLPAQVAERVSPFAALCAALAPEDVAVEIWAPAAVDPARLAAPAGWRPPAMRTGVPPRVDLTWANTDAKPVNDRRFALATATELGCALQGARAVSSVAELAAHLAAGGAAASPTRAWVCKAPWTTAGRDRVFGAGPAIGADLETPLARLFAAHRVLVFEPWLERLLDVGVCGMVTASSVEVRAPHRLLTSRRGTFRGIEIGRHVADTGLEPVEHDVLLETAEHTGAALVRAGYVGPFGIDAFVHHAGGRRQLHALCEINARFTFGHVAHALAERLGARSLGFGAIAPEGAVVLVDSERGAHAGAWVTLRA